MSVKRYQLKPNTLLDGRYRIGKVLGEGGFGITYEGINQRIGMHVAIKEFFCRDYMDRDNEKSEDVFLSEPSMQDRFCAEKQRFLKEARILSDFSSENGVVHIVDYFEIHNTAYIVMPYLGGKTLRQYVGENGPMEAETIFRKMKPLLQTLEKVHETGLIHRDISPDNIMLLADGSLCLIDFGAAYRYNHHSKSYTIISKHGYAAPEQYKADGKIGPAADVYALTATLYFCLTGVDPEDSLQRILLDELKTPVELGIDLPKPANELMVKGLELKEQNRWKSIREMIEKIDQAFPEKPEPGPVKKKYILAAIAAAIVICAVIGFSWYNAHRTEIRFKNIETETIWLTAKDNTTVSEYAQSARIVKERLEVFAGKNNYLWEENDGEIRFELPLECLQGKDPDYVCQAYLTRPMQTYLYNSKTSRSIADPQKGAVPVPREAFEKVEILQGEIEGVDRELFKLPETGDYKYIRITLTEQAAAAINLAYDNILQKKEDLYLYYDLYEDYAVSYLEDCRTCGDGKSFDLINWDQTGSFFDVLLYDLTHEPSVKPFVITSEWVVSSEDELKKIVTGKNQVKDGELTGEVLQLRYSSDINIEEQKASWLHNLVAFKDRLDALEIPYEFYLMENEQLAGKSTFVVVVQKDVLPQFILSILPESYLSYRIGSDWGSTEYISTAEFKDGGISCPFSNYDYDRLKNLASVYEEAEVKEVVLFAGSIPAARCSLEEFRQGLENGAIQFSNVLFSKNAEEYERTRRLLTLMKRQSMASSLSLDEVYLADRDQDIKPIWISREEQIEALPLPYHEDTKLYDSLDRFAESHGGKFAHQYEANTGMQLQFWFFDQDRKTLAQNLLKFSEELIEAHYAELNSPLVSSISVHFSLGSKGDDALNKLVLIFSRSSTRCRIELSEHLYFYHESLFTKEEAVVYRQKLLRDANKRIIGSPLKDLFELDWDTKEPYTQFDIY